MEIFDESRYILALDRVVALRASVTMVAHRIGANGEYRHVPTANTSGYSGRMKTLELAYEFSVHVTGLDVADESKLTRLSDEQFTVVPFASDGLLMLAV